MSLRHELAARRHQLEARADAQRAMLAAAAAPHLRRLSAGERLFRLAQWAAGVAFTLRFLLRRG